MNADNSGLNQVVQFFNSRASMNDISDAIGITQLLMTIAILLVTVLGFVAMAIWVSRIGVDVVIIAGRGTMIADKLQNFGTSNDTSSYDTVGKYVKANAVNIVMVIVLIALMVTGWMWRIFAMALQGIGGMMNYLMGLDFDGLISAQEAASWASTVAVKPAPAIKSEYDDNLNQARAALNEIYSLADMDNSSPQKQDLARRYGTSLARAQVVANSADSANVTTTMKLQNDYFSRHLKPDSCNTNLLKRGNELGEVANEAVAAYSEAGVSSISCQ